MMMFSEMLAIPLQQHFLNDLLIFLWSRGDAKHHFLSNNIPLYVTERFHAT